MCVSIEVTPSATVGKQVYPVPTGTNPTSAQQKILDGVILTAGVSAATLVIRDGNASGDVRLTAKLPTNTSYKFDMDDHRFDKGMHVKVTPASAIAYLLID